MSTFGESGKNAIKLTKDSADGFLFHVAPLMSLIVVSSSTLRER